MNIDRRAFSIGMAASVFARPALSQASADWEVTFFFAADIHACRMSSGLSPNCQQEGKTDQALLRHIAALNRLPLRRWPSPDGEAIAPLAVAGRPIGEPRALVLGGDLTDDGGGQTVEPREGTQLLQFSHRYQQGAGADRIHFPVYAGLGNHDLDQDGRPPDADWYRQEMRDYIEVNHEPGVFFKPPLPAGNFDRLSDSYSWDWEGLHLVQLHRFGGDTRKDAVSGLQWLRDDLKAIAGRPVVLFQHYGWDPFSIERWDGAANSFDDHGDGAPHWWSDSERQALLDAIAGANVIGIFHGHQHETPMIYRHGQLDLFKPKASFLGGFAVVRVTSRSMDVALGQAVGPMGEVAFTNALSKSI